MQPINRAKSPRDGDFPVDRLMISVRSYVVAADKRKRKSKAGASDRWSALRIPPSDWVLVFDCETRTTPDQNLRFGAYQLRWHGHIWERGAFYDPTLSTQDLKVLRGEIAKEVPSPDGEKICLLTREQFVRDVFFERGFKQGAQIVGFNLPFDLSRLAIGHVPARHSMKGGFSLTLIDGKEWPRVSVKHLSQRAALIRFTGTEIPKKKSQRDASDVFEEDQPRDPDRGYFVDLKTLAAAFTSESHSLASLSKLLAVNTIKVESDDHGEALKPEYVRYGMRDVQTTWECFDALAKRFASLGLTDTGVYDLYSEASLGKAYLKTMGIKPWLELARDNFPDELVGHIMSAYYGGRSEVHIRRQIVPVIHTDFLSMYPTVSTLMGIWEFVRAKSVEPQEDAETVRAFVERCTPELLRNQDTWRELACIVQVLPDRDLFPVRAHCAEGEAATIGLNCLNSDEPLWFSLADVLVSKILTGRTPNILRAVRFRPNSIQDGLQPVTVAGRTIDPTKDDFYRALINHRRTVRAREAVAEGEEERRLHSEQLGIKILANATSYGIFVELNVNELETKEPMLAYGFRDHPARIKSDQHEKPGRYFHPLLATLTTGAARLMLALAERQVIDQELDWAFCDTDSMAIANPTGMPLSQFKERALAVREWFQPLNPYEVKGPILQLEKVNFPKGEDGNVDRLDPPNCLAISAKRYVLFNEQQRRKAKIRKASGHGLGHLLDPYDDPPKKRKESISEIGVPRWEADVWAAIIQAAQTDEPDAVPLAKLSGFDSPAASRYAATTPVLLRWFKRYNENLPYSEQVKPFNFLISLHAKSRIEMAAIDRRALDDALWQRRVPRPAAPYYRDPKKAGAEAFDRERRGKHIDISWLETYSRNLVRYHLHPENKFWGGDFDQRGILRRRHVRALAARLIGKEADEIEEQEFLGEGEGPIERPLAPEDQKRLLAIVQQTQKECGVSVRQLCSKAGISHHTLVNFRKGGAISDNSLLKLIRAAEALRQEHEADAENRAELLRLVRQKASEVGGRNALAKLLGVSPTYMGRVLSGTKPVTELLEQKLWSFTLAPGKNTP